VLTLREGTVFIELEAGKAKGLSLKTLGIPLDESTRIRKGQVNEFLQTLDDDTVGRRFQNIRATLVEALEGGQKSVKLFLQYEVFGDENVPVEAERGVVPALIRGEDTVQVLPDSPCFLPYAGHWYENHAVFDLDADMFDLVSRIRLTALGARVRRV